MLRNRTLSDMLLVEVLAGGKGLTPDEVLRAMNFDDTAKPKIIENNITMVKIQPEYDSICCK